ncbi:MAG TPA: hypothetical protein VF541_04305 [Longimicrobium sp.]|jgi:hypothetical protein
MMIVLFVVLAVITAVLAVVVLVTRELRRARRARSRVTVDQLSRWVNSMLLRCAPGATLLAAANGGPKFLQLAVTGREDEWRRVEFGLPDAEWSHENFALAALSLEEGAAAASVEHAPENAHVPRFLRITLEGERAEVTERASELLRRAAAVLELAPEQTYTVSVQGSDHPDYLREMVRAIEQSRLPRWFARRVTAQLQRQAAKFEAAAGAEARPPQERQQIRPRGR